jgi:predicted ATP-binding protein involved in virulence
LALQFENLDGTEVSFAKLSSGIKHLIVLLCPLYYFNTKNSIVLFDEIENSLFPDIQRIIIDLITKLTPFSQLFFATHSPIIASSFEPWEIVELKFNEEGKVYRELYYESENHVDNYTIDPQYMRWDDILNRVFDMENDGSELRRIELDNLAMLNVKFRKMQNNGAKDSVDSNEIATEINKLKLKLSKWD